MSSHEIVGIDVAARKLVVIGERLALAEYENTAAGRSKLVNALSRSPQPVRVVLEATGIYFLDLACELAAGIAVMVVNPKPAPGNEQGAAVLVIGELSVLPPMTARQWVAQAGLDVREETSGSSLARRPRLSKRGNKRLREALFYPALTATRCCPAAAAPCSLPGAGFVDRLVAHGKTRLQAIVALMRKLLHGLHAMWRNNEDFDAEKLFAPA